MNSLETVFLTHKDPGFASWQEAYMRHKFSFLGIRQPIRKRLQAPLLKQLGKAYIRELWEKKEREFHYTAMDAYWIDAGKEEDLDLLQWLITTNSWWDTVDVLASKHCGMYFKQFPHQIEITKKWVKSPNLWLRRSALLFQLRYKASTDFSRLSEYCLILAQETDPFIQRAIGWALREYGKTEPHGVMNFINQQGNLFSHLTQREATCLLTSTI